MLIYEKNNKLNINFDNEVNENPDLQIGKEDGKTEVLIDGQQGGGSGGSVLVVHESDEPRPVLDKTWKEICDALKSGFYVVIITVERNVSVNQYLVHTAFLDGVYTVRAIDGIQATVEYETDTENGYPIMRA